MGKIFKQNRVKLISSIIYRHEEDLFAAESQLKKLYGKTDELEGSFPFDRTDYYYEEMGRPLRRKFLSFSKLLPKEKLYQSKTFSCRIEEKLAEGGKRRVNIDPGYVTEAKLVLFTTKDYTHRIYLAGGIFSEVTLFFQDGKFNAWPWTYPDYASQEVIDYFNSVRDLYIKQARGSTLQEPAGKAL